MSKILHRNLHTVLPVVRFAEKNYFLDSKGTKYLDACGGAAVSCLGHSNARVIAAIREQLETAPYAHTGFFTNEPAEELAASLIDRAPAGFGDGRVMFLGSGSEAMEAALKLVRQYHMERGQDRRAKFISREGSYHGNTLGALAMGGHFQRRQPFLPMLMDVSRIPPCYAYRLAKTGESPAEFGSRMADLLEDKILEIDPGTVAAFLAEPISGATLGCVPPAPGYFQKIRRICDTYDTLFLADEIMCGMGRTGSLFAIEQEGVCPDIIVIAKGLGAGYQPISAVMASEKVIRAIQKGSGTLWNGHTYMCHAASCAGALAVLKEIESKNLLAHVRIQGRKLEKLLKESFGNHAHVGDIRGRGLFWALELVLDRTTKQPFPAEGHLAQRLKTELFESGLLCYPTQGCVDGIQGDHLLLAPPYTVSDEELSFIINRVEMSLEKQFARFRATH